MVPCTYSYSMRIANDTTLQGEYVQFVTYAISPSVLKNISIYDGVKTMGGYLKSFIPVDAVIKSGHELVQKSGSIMVALWEGETGGSVEVFQFNKAIGGSSGNIYRKFPTKDAYEKSFENRIVRCRIYPWTNCPDFVSISNSQIVFQWMYLLPFFAACL